MKLRLISYNIHKCIGGIDRRYRPERIVEVLAHYQADILFLQEVDNAAKRSNRDCQAERLAQWLGYPHQVWNPNVPVRGGGHHGNAILSRFPILDSRNIDITVARKKTRGILCGRIDLSRIYDRKTSSEKQDKKNPKSLHLFNVHLGLTQRERKEQLRIFLKQLTCAKLDPDAAVIVGGDLNDLYGNLGSNVFRPAGFNSRGAHKATFPAYAPIRTLDGIYVRGQVELVRLQRSRLRLAKTASDHLPLIADLVIEVTRPRRSVKNQ